MPKPPPDENKIALILADADDMGVDGAVKKHGISARTITNYRKRRDSCASLANKCASVKSEIMATWIEQAKATRTKLLARVEALAETSDDLHAVTGAYKIVNDGILAEQVVSEGEDGGRTESGDGVAVTRRPVAQVEGAATRLEH